MKTIQTSASPLQTTSFKGPLSNYTIKFELTIGVVKTFNNQNSIQGSSTANVLRNEEFEPLANEEFVDSITRTK